MKFYGCGFNFFHQINDSLSSICESIEIQFNADFNFISENINDTDNLLDSTILKFNHKPQIRFMWNKILFLIDGKVIDSKNEIVPITLRKNDKIIGFDSTLKTIVTINNVINDSICLWDSDNAKITAFNLVTSLENTNKPVPLDNLENKQIAISFYKNEQMVNFPRQATKNTNNNFITQCNSESDQSSTVTPELTISGTNYTIVKLTENNDILILNPSSHTLKIIKLNSQLNEIEIIQNNPLPEVKINEISCGKNHSLLLSTTGIVYSLGLGNQGQLGHGSVEPINEPRIIEALQGICIQQISAGGWHSLALSDWGDLYSWGWNNHGQLGFPCKEVEETSETNELSDTTNAQENKNPKNDYIGIQIIPKWVEHIYSKTHKTEQEVPTFVQISSGTRHIVVLSDSQTAYSCGWNKYGQLGLGDRIDRDMLTEIVWSQNKFNSRVKNVFAGAWNTIFEF